MLVQGAFTSSFSDAEHGVTAQLNVVNEMKLSIGLKPGVQNYKSIRRHDCKVVFKA